jgi:hypothetical protein
VGSWLPPGSSAFTLFPFRGVLYRFDDLHVSGATAEISGNGRSDFLLVR